MPRCELLCRLSVLLDLLGECIELFGHFVQALRKLYSVVTDDLVDLHSRLPSAHKRPVGVVSLELFIFVIDRWPTRLSRPELRTALQLFVPVYAGFDRIHPLGLRAS